MGKTTNSRAYSQISSMKDLRDQKRLLSSRIEHQEIMISYKFRTLKDYISPARLLYLGCDYLASHNSSFNIAFRAFNFVRSLFTERKG